MNDVKQPKKIINKPTLEYLYPLLWNQDIHVFRYSSNRALFKGRKNPKYKKYKNWIVEGIWNEIQVDKSQDARHTFTSAEAFLCIAITPPDEF